MSVDIRATFESWRQSQARPAWRPVCVDGGEGEARFGGGARLAPGEAWPTCAGCGDPMQVFVQVPLAGLPAGSPGRGDGLLQLFYCSRDDGACETWRPFSGTQLVRVLTGEHRPAPHPDGLAPLPVRSIEGWSELVDYPDTAEHEQLGLHYAYDFERKRVTVTCPELGVTLPDLDLALDVAETIAIAEPGDKLGGWPVWIQGVEYPACPRCRRPMELILQIDSNDNLAYMFGDVGTGHVTRCPDHPEVLAFGWACS